VKQVLEQLEASPEKFGSNKRLYGMVTALSEELPEQPLFMTLSSMCKTINVLTPPLQSIKNIVKAQGYNISVSHTEPLALKTNAPTPLLWDILREWQKENPAKNLQNDSIAQRILAKETNLKLVFTKIPQEKDPHDKDKKKVSKFLPNPTENWGPLSRAGSNKKRSREKSATQKIKKQKKDEDTKDLIIEDEQDKEEEIDIENDDEPEDKGKEKTEN